MGVDHWVVQLPGPSSWSRKSSIHNFADDTRNGCDAHHGRRHPDI